jgi:hypothetical protein
MLVLGECDHEIVAVPVPGPPGTPGSGGAGNAQEFVFSSPAATWTMNHSLGRRPAGVVLILSDGSMFLSDVEINGTTQVVATHAVPLTGRAELM